MKDKKIRQYRSNQGRSPEQEEESAKVILLATILFSIAILIIAIFG